MKLYHDMTSPTRGRIATVDVENGERYTINIEPRGIPLRDYLKLQGRFKHLNDEQIEELQRSVNIRWERLLKAAVS